MVSSAVHSNALLSLVFLGLSLEVLNLLLTNVSGRSSTGTRLEPTVVNLPPLMRYPSRPYVASEYAFVKLLLHWRTYLVRVRPYCGMWTEEKLKLPEDNVSGQTIAGHPPLLLV
jgi:hypothetical protein